MFDLGSIKGRLKQPIVERWIGTSLEERTELCLPKRNIGATEIKGRNQKDGIMKGREHRSTEFGRCVHVEAAMPDDGLEPTRAVTILQRKMEEPVIGIVRFRWGIRIGTIQGQEVVECVLVKFLHRHRHQMPRLLARTKVGPRVCVHVDLLLLDEKLERFDQSKFDGNGWIVEHDVRMEDAKFFVPSGLGHVVFLKITHGGPLQPFDPFVGALIPPADVDLHPRHDVVPAFGPIGSNGEILPNGMKKISVIS
mmetsp:Transcript_20972/g.45742  ORF Transcript_20972/g.45742 Transcript_20972/m.45742 type:complete len:252 (-) Transcript_20972:235-990(-)